MAENVHKKLSVRHKPARDRIEQIAVVVHVFEHLDGDDPVESILGYEVVHVLNDYVNICQAPFLRLAHYEFTL